MTAPHRHDRLVLLALIFLCVGILIGSIYLFWQSKLSAPQVTLQPQPVTLTAKPQEKIFETPCYGVILPNDFEVTLGSECSLNAYARPRKYQYINVDSYTAGTSLAEYEQTWRTRWLTLGATLSSREEVVWDGLPALRLVERYASNNEAFVTYLVPLPRPLPLGNGRQARAFELRGWGTTTDDQRLVDDLIQHWQWRF